MILKDLLQVMDDITQLDINAINFKEHLYITDVSKIPTHLLYYQVDYVGAKCEDVLSIFLIEKIKKC